MLSLVVTAGQRGDSPQFKAVLEAFGCPARAVASRFDKLAVRYEATVHVAAIGE
jgi:hypothetical protein